jgi:serine/threonine protein kinase
MPRQLMVIDGADRGQSFLLPDAGTIRIGNSRKNTDICLHDLFVARVHCHVDVADGKVTVSDELKPNGILVNGAKVAQQELQPGDVVRVGNSYLRLEEADASALTDTKINGAATEPGKLPHLPRERLGALTGHFLGHYELGIALSHGHYGVVFRARHDKTEQSAALKVLPAGFPANDEEMQRFIRAMKPRMALQHPGLVALRGVGKSGPYVWVAAEFVEGESAATVIRRWQSAGKFKWRAALRSALQLSKVLELLHQHHLVHANITPANVLLPEDGTAARLNDLGLWDALIGSELQEQTLEKKFLAELPYLSPEHADPEAPVDDLSDQYSVGAVIYGLLTGRPPCEGATTEETIEKVRTALPARPKEFQKSIPDAFQAVVLRMLARRPEDRYPGAGPLVADLEAVAMAHADER